MVRQTGTYRYVTLKCRSLHLTKLRMCSLYGHVQNFCTYSSHYGTLNYVFRNVMAHAQKPDFVYRRNGRVHLNRRGRQFSRLLAAEVCASAVVM